MIIGHNTSTLGYIRTSVVYIVPIDGRVLYLKYRGVGAIASEAHLGGVADATLYLCICTHTYWVTL